MTTSGSSAIQIEPEVVLLLVPATFGRSVIEDVVRVADVTATGHGPIFTVTVQQMAGIDHLPARPAP